MREKLWLEPLNATNMKYKIFALDIKGNTH